MKVKKVEILFTGIIAVSDRPVPIDISSIVEKLKGIIEIPLNVGTTVDGKTTIVSSPRSQIDIIQNQSRLEVRDNSGLEPGQKPLPKVIADTLKQLEFGCVAYGFNYDLLISLESTNSPGEIIRDKFLNTSKLKIRTPSAVVGAAVKVRYSDKSTISNLLLDTHGSPDSERFHVNLNVHWDAKQLPVPSALSKSFKDRHRGLIMLLKSW